jgi:hypothetical protein
MNDDNVHFQLLKAGCMRETRAQIDACPAPPLIPARKFTEEEVEAHLAKAPYVKSANLDMFFQEHGPLNDIYNKDKLKFTRASRERKFEGVFADTRELRSSLIENDSENGRF